MDDQSYGELKQSAEDVANLKLGQILGWDLGHPQKEDPKMKLNI